MRGGRETDAARRRLEQRVAELALERRQPPGDGRRRHRWGVGGRGERAVIGDRSQRSQPSKVDDEADLTASLHKVQSLLSVDRVTVLAMPRRHVAIAAGRASAVPLGALALTIGAAASWGVGNVVTRKAHAPNPLGLLVYSSLIPPLPLLALSVATERGQAVELGAGGVLALLYVVVLSTLIGFGAWAWLLSRHPASTVAPFTLLVPVVGIASAWLMLSELPTVAELAGAAVVLGGLALTVGLTGPGPARQSRPPCAGSPSPSPQPARP